MDVAKIQKQKVGLLRINTVPIQNDKDPDRQGYPRLTLVELEVLELAQQIFHDPVDVLLEGLHLSGPVVILQVFHHLNIRACE